MNKLEQAARQALEALEALNPYPASKENQRFEAITALREALAEQAEPEVWYCPDCGTLSEAQVKCCPDWIRSRKVTKNFALTCKATFDRQEQAEQPVSQEYQDHLVNQSFDWAAMAAKHQFMEGYRIGLAEMREKCAKVVTEHAPTCSPHWVSYVVAIRAIKFEGDTGFRPVSEMVGCAYCNNPLFAGTKCNNCGRITLAEQAEREPVAWWNGKETVWFEHELITDGPVGECKIPLYAAPVRTKDLTDDEILPIAKEIYKLEWVPDAAVRYFGLFARAVIAADREKNRG